MVAGRAEAQAQHRPAQPADAEATAGKIDVITFGWANEPMIDAYSILVQVLRSKSGTAGVFNWGGWTPRIDELIDKAARELDHAQAARHDDRSAEDRQGRVIFIPLHQQPMAWAMRSTESTPWCSCPTTSRVSGSPHEVECSSRAAQRSAG